MSIKIDLDHLLKGFDRLKVNKVSVEAEQFLAGTGEPVRWKVTISTVPLATHRFLFDIIEEAYVFAADLLERHPEAQATCEGFGGTLQQSHR